jgi:hypothetical protein
MTTSGFEATPAGSDALDETLVRLHRCGPEWRGRLSNHAPMVVEALVRHGRVEDVEGWVDRYESRLDASPRATSRIDPSAWRQALGDPSRLGDWTAFFDDEIRDAAWADVLTRWWPRLLPGLAASATHSVIRLGHCVQALRTAGPSQPRLDELAQTLGYWAARWLPVAGDPAPAGAWDVATALDRVPALDGPDAAFPDLLEALGRDPRWPAAAGSVDLATEPDAVEPQLRDLVTAATLHYRTHGAGEPIMLVHAATAPNAVLRVLPSLPRDLWSSSLRAAWTATAAVTMIYNPTKGPSSPDQPVPDRPVAVEPDDVFDRAVAHGDEHVIKLADTALDVHAWSSDPRALGAAALATTMIERD